jgi:protein ImuA
MATAAPCLQAVWHADRMGTYKTPTVPTGYAALDDELPEGGWPASMLIELLLPHSGIGEMRLLRPALSAIAEERRIAFVQPPHLPQIATCTAWEIAPERLLWIKTAHAPDALWSAEQILRNGSCGALLCWQTQIRSEALRRLHLAAQAAGTVFWMMRPMTAAQQPSPAPLRLGLMPARGGIRIRMVKRRGPWREDSFDVPFPEMTAFPFNAASTSHAFLDRRTPTLVTARSDTPELVGTGQACGAGS